MHVCPQEVMALVTAVPSLHWILALVIRWRARRRPMDPTGFSKDWREKLRRIAVGETHSAPCGCSNDELHGPVEVIECRGCGERIEDDGWSRERLGEGY